MRLAAVVDMISPGMNIVLLAMPDSFERMPTIGIRMPDGAFASLAANVDARHDVAAVMTFQRTTSATVAPARRGVHSPIPRS